MSTHYRVIGVLSPRKLLIVFAILALLASAGVPLYLWHLESVKKSRAWTDAKTLEKVEETYRIQNGR